jgi:hypothetical protein
MLHFKFDENSSCLIKVALDIFKPGHVGHFFKEPPPILSIFAVDWLPQVLID